MIGWLFGGVLVGTGVFAALLWSFYQAALQRGALQVAHIGAALFTLAGMGSLSMASPVLAQVNGVALLGFALAAIGFESGWNRALPLFQLIFALALILGLPFRT